MRLPRFFTEELLSSFSFLEKTARYVKDCLHNVRFSFAKEEKASDFAPDFSLLFLEFSFEVFFLKSDGLKSGGVEKRRVKKRRASVCFALFFLCRVFLRRVRSFPLTKPLDFAVFCTKRKFRIKATRRRGSHVFVENGEKLQRVARK